MKGRKATPLPAALGALLVACGSRSLTPPPVTAPDDIQRESAGLTLDWSASTCRTAVLDEDADSLDDRCEVDLAAAFAPLLRVEAGGCNWDRSVARAAAIPATPR